MADSSNGAPVLTPQMRAALRINLDKMTTARKLYANDHSDQVARRLRTAESHVGQVEFVEALWARVKLLEEYTDYVANCTELGYAAAPFADWVLDQENEEREKSD